MELFTCTKNEMFDQGPAVHTRARSCALLFTEWPSTSRSTGEGHCSLPNEEFQLDDLSFLFCSNFHGAWYMVCKPTKTSLTRKNPGIVARRPQWDFIQFNYSSPRTNDIFYNYDSKCHIWLKDARGGIWLLLFCFFFFRQNWQNESNKNLLDVGFLIIFKSPKFV